MTSIGKFLVAGAAATQESTFALANMNFDFSLIKMEAPLEYRRFGTALSRKRKTEAEMGSIHITARKLGALFADDLPDIPALAQAYGLRVSEIAENPEYNPKGSASDGPFADYVGADGTSIWAAATSGRGAMAAHLLACLLARVWSGPEAISIWSEIVATRKHLLQTRIQEQQFHIGAVTACQIEIGREKLSEWDASARSWLRIADAAMNLQQTQLMLIVENVDMPLPSKPNVYDEVMKVWTVSLKIAEALVSGVAQSVQSGEALLGLSSWHLYPDICALGQKTTVVRQKDSLVQDGGLVTIGLHSSRKREGQGTGVTWSMPLSTLRFYGHPVKARGDVGSSTTRVSFDHFLEVFLGSVLSTWRNRDSSLDKVARFLNLFADVVLAENDMYNGLTPWPRLLTQLCERYLNSNEHAKSEIDRYVALGRRRCGNSLTAKGYHPRPCFSLSDPRVYIQLTKPDNRISALRDMARTFDPPYGLETAIIRFIHPEHIEGYRIWEFATLVPQLMPGAHWPLHRRWIIFPEEGYNESGSGIYTKKIQLAIERSLEIMTVLGEPCGFLKNSAISINFEGPRKQELVSFEWTNSMAPMSAEDLVKRSSWANHILPSSERLIGWQRGTLENAYDGHQYSLAYGDAMSAAVYQPLEKVRPYDYILPIDYVSNFLASNQIDKTRLYGFFECFTNPTFISPDVPTYYLSLITVTGAHKIYSSLPKAKIDLHVTSKVLSRTRWASKFLSGRSGMVDRSISFACVAMFDTGCLDIAPEDLVHVLALASTNTFYASEMLFRDPFHAGPSHALRHVIGNLGKPGLSLLVSPRNTILRDITLETWSLANFTPFDGRFEDSFASTSLHLSLTGYEQPLNTEHHGDRDQMATFVEAAISAYEGGTWVADLDLFHLFQTAGQSPERSSQIQNLPIKCSHSAKAKAEFSVFDGITSIDNWYEYLDRPMNPAVIRAKKNWIARLAFAAIPLPDREKLIIGSENICWTCAKLMLVENCLPNDRQLFLC